jgi:hypothetical protein
MLRHIFTEHEGNLYEYSVAIFDKIKNAVLDEDKEDN